MLMSPSKYIAMLQVRITNLYHKQTRWKDDAYLQMIRFTDELNIIRDSLSNGKNVLSAMLALNRKLITQEGQTPGKKFIRSAQSRARFQTAINR